MRLRADRSSTSSPNSIFGTTWGDAAAVYGFLGLDELGRNLGERSLRPLRPANLDHDVAAVDPTKFVQTLYKIRRPNGSQPKRPGIR